VRLRQAFSLAAALYLALGAISLLAADTDQSYRASVAKWRQDYETSLKAEDGWLSVSGLFWLHEGENQFGSDPLNDIVLPSSVPAHAGTFVYAAGKTTLHANSAANITLNGKKIEDAELHPDVPSDRVRLGDLTLYVHASGTRHAIRVKDKNSKIRKDFTGLSWFPVDESYRVTAKFVPYTPAKQVKIQTVMGDFDNDSIAGYVVFSLHGKEYRLDAEQDKNMELSFVFRDLTSGKLTYPAARFLDAEAPKNGMVVLDFNQAYNPPCAYNPYTTCPIPAPENRLRVEIPAGEKIYGHER
jgi:uncharacterized protein (DUF1684 family)